MQKMKTYYGYSFIFCNNFEQGWDKLMQKGQSAQGLNPRATTSGVVKANNPVSPLKMKQSYNYILLPPKQRCYKLRLYIPFQVYSFFWTTCTFEIQQAHFTYDNMLNNYPPSKCVEVGRREIFKVSLLNKWKLVPTILV